MTFAIVLLLFALAFTVSLAAVYVAWRVIERRHTAATTAAGGESAASGSWTDDLPGLLKSEELSSISFWDGLLKQLDVVTLLTDRIAQAELNWSPGRVTLGMLLCGTVAFAIVWQISFIPFWLGVLAVPLASMIPYWYILFKRKRRFRRFQSLFPDALDSFARALRAGSAVSAALEMVALESDGPGGCRDPQDVRRGQPRHALGSRASKSQPAYPFDRGRPFRGGSSNPLADRRPSR